MQWQKYTKFLLEFLPLLLITLTRTYQISDLEYLRLVRCFCGYCAEFQLRMFAA